MRYEVKALRGEDEFDGICTGCRGYGRRHEPGTGAGLFGHLDQAESGLAGVAQARHQQISAGPVQSGVLALLEAGLSLMESLEALAEKEQQPEIRKTLAQIIASLYEGHTFSYALQHSPANFPLLYVATVRACEKTGALPEALSRYVAYQSQMDAVKRQVVSASIYPLLLAAVGGLVTLFLMVYVVPRFSHIYADIAVTCP